MSSSDFSELPVISVTYFIIIWIVFCYYLFLFVWIENIIYIFIWIVDRIVFIKFWFALLPVVACYCKRSANTRQSKQIHNTTSLQIKCLQIQCPSSFFLSSVHDFRHSNVSSLPSLFNEIVGELSSCFRNSFLKSFFVYISESQDVSCWGCNANTTIVR